MILHLWTWVDFCSWLTGYRMLFSGGKCGDNSYVSCKGTLEPQRDGVCWDFGCTSDGDTVVPTHSSMQVREKSACKETRYQKGVDNMLFVRMSILPPHNPCYKVIYEIYVCYFPLHITESTLFICTRFPYAAYYAVNYVLWRWKSMY